LSLHVTHFSAVGTDSQVTNAGGLFSRVTRSLTVAVSFRMELPQAMDGVLLRQGPLSAFLQWLAYLFVTTDQCQVSCGCEAELALFQIGSRIRRAFLQRLFWTEARDYPPFTAKRSVLHRGQIHSASPKKSSFPRQWEAALDSCRGYHSTFNSQPSTTLSTDPESPASRGRGECGSVRGYRGHAK